MTGGAAPYRKGAAFERDVRAYYERLGWVVTRQPKSQSPYDLVALKNGKAHLVQCKTNGKLSKADRALLFEVAFRVPAIPVLAYKHERKVVLVNLFDGDPVESL
jgi:Holliday junction resolvase